MTTAALKKNHQDQSPAEIAKACFEAYANKDRDAIEALIADEFSFTSPIDNQLDRKTYFERCWPNSKTAKKFDYIHAIDDGDRAFITYEVEQTSGKKFRNTEIFTVKNGQITDVEVYFGWDKPHKAKPGKFIEHKPKAS